MTTDRLIPMREVLTIIPVSERTWERWLASGKVPDYVRSGRQRFWKLSDIQNWIEANKKTATVA